MRFYNLQILIALIFLNVFSTDVVLLSEVEVTNEVDTVTTTYYYKNSKELDSLVGFGKYTDYKDIYTYNNNGLVEDITRYDGILPEIILLNCIYTYDENDRLLVDSTLIGGAFVIPPEKYLVHHYTYYSDSVKDSCDYYLNYSDTVNHNVYNTTYLDDENNDTFKISVAMSGVGTTTTRYTYYDEKINGKKLLDSSIVEKENQLIQYSKKFYTNDTLIQMYTYRPPSPGGTEKHIWTTYNYGELISVSNNQLNKNEIQKNINIYGTTNTGIIIDLKFKMMSDMKGAIYSVSGKKLYDFSNDKMGSINKKILIDKEVISATGIYIANIDIDGMSISKQFIMK